MGVGIVVTSGKSTLCNGSTLAWNARDVGLSPVLGTIFPIFITPTTVVPMTMILSVQARRCLVVEPTQ